ncbi:GDYXXLXY domain-containing protein [Sediminibacillus massiliensis]|uniref:GDYXXLXY domain-containing protein n=1 Tax=Sediminibacillus massiliensis TaxID=1926277 RepID=UPI00098831B2|nr:GDYXXLXY domain-containing protein [Sediminibacillus massiliensis]
MKKILFYSIVILQILFLAGMSGAYYLVEDWGEKVKLRTEPIDPQDVFYGDYVHLRYQAQNIDEEQWEGEQEDISRNTKVYVTLRENSDGFHEVERASVEKLKPADGQVVLTAVYQYYDHYENTHSVDYGISRYFVEDNTGQEIESSRQEMFATVSASPWGQKRILSLEIAE